MASKVKKISSGTFKILSYLECSWENPWVFREHAPLAPHFSRLWFSQVNSQPKNIPVCGKLRWNKLSTGTNNIGQMGSLTTPSLPGSHG